MSAVAISPGEVRKAARAVRARLAAGLARLDAGDIDGAYAEIEGAQHAAYDAKMLVVNGGAYEEEATP